VLAVLGVKEPAEVRGLRRALHYLALNRGCSALSAAGATDQLTARGARSPVIGLALEASVVVTIDALELRGRGNPTLALLHHVGELVPEQLLTMLAVWLVLSGREVDVCTLGVPERIERRGMGAFVHAHRREVGAQCRPHLGLYVTGERLAAAARRR
jgi:hypothetical protein